MRTTNTNKFKKVTMVIILVLSICFTSISANAKKKVKYTKTEKKLAEAIANYQFNNLIDPDSFKLKAIYKVNYKLKDDYADMYKELGEYEQIKTVSYFIMYTGANAFGDTVTNYFYISSTYHCFDNNEVVEFMYKKCANYNPYKVKKKFFNNVKKLEKKYYNKM